jgi:hypothetical protein
MTETHPFWDVVEAVLVINLDHRGDRWERVVSTIGDRIPKGKLHRVPAILGVNIPGYGKRPWFRNGKRNSNWASRAGCTLSHKKALELASDYKTCLIIEDDIELTDSFDRVAAELADALKKRPTDWDVCYLGFTDPWGPQKKLCQLSHNHGLYRVFGCTCAHAYLVNAYSATWMSQQLPSQENVWKWVSRYRISDRWFLRHLGRRFKVGCVSPSIVNQYADYSDIVHKKIDYAHSVKHRIELSGPNRSGMPFDIRYALRQIYSYTVQGYDNFRGIIKRWRGF